MKQPPSIQPAASPGPDYDPMDWIIQEIENLESFLSYLEMHPKNLDYLHSHLSGILGLRRTLSQRIDTLAEEPYNYPPSRLTTLHQENERLFTYLEGAVGALDPWDEALFKKAVHAFEETLLKFDEHLTP